MDVQPLLAMDGSQGVDGLLVVRERPRSAVVRMLTQLYRRRLRNGKDGMDGNDNMTQAKGTTRP